MPSEDTQFKPGNMAAFKTGLRSIRVRQRYREELLVQKRALLAAELGVEPDAPGYQLLIDLAATAAADVHQVRSWIDSQGGPISTRGQIRNAVEMLRGRERDLLQYLDRLGIGPRAAAQLASLSTTARGPMGPAAQLARPVLVELPS